jgi:hypothetical protein
MKNYDNNDSSEKNLEREFAERVRVIEYAKLYDQFVALLANPQNKKPMADPGALIHILEGAAIPALFKGDVYKFIQTIFGKATPEVSAILSDEIKRFRADKFLDWVLAADAKIKASGRELSSVDIDDVLIPLIQGISNKKNTSIQEMYANLLTAAIAGEKVGVGDVSTLKMLEGNDVLILEAIYQSPRDCCRSHDLIYISKLSKEEFDLSIDGLMAQGIIESTSLKEAIFSIEIALSGIDRDRGASEYIKPGDIMLDLEIIERSFQNALKTVVEAQTVNKYDSIKFTTRGWEFMRKCKGIITKSIETEQNP